jgi:hypothetical protein
MITKIILDITTALPVISIDYYLEVYFFYPLIESFFLKFATVRRKVRFDGGMFGCCWVGV